jgi:small conductance mechanosensitive channel
MMNLALQKFYYTAINWVLLYGPRILISVFVLFFGFWLIKIIRQKLNRKMSRKQVHSSLQPFIESLVFTSLHVGLALLIMEILGIQLTLFAALIAAFGAAVGLALSGTLQNFASGVIILFLKPFTNGDNIIAQGYEGTVTTIQIFYTVITTFDKRTVIMPNSKLSNEVIVNITRIGTRRLDAELKFAFGADLPGIKDVINKTIMASADVLKEPVPRIGVSSFADDGYKVIVNMWLNAHGFEDVKLIIHERILLALKDAGIWSVQK